MVGAGAGALDCRGDRGDRSHPGIGGRTHLHRPCRRPAACRLRACSAGAGIAPGLGSRCGGALRARLGHAALACRRGSGDGALGAGLRDPGLAARLRRAGQVAAPRGLRDGRDRHRLRLIGSAAGAERGAQRRRSRGRSAAAAGGSLRLGADGLRRPLRRRAGRLPVRCRGTGEPTPIGRLRTGASSWLRSWWRRWRCSSTCSSSPSTSCPRPCRSPLRSP